MAPSKITTDRIEGYEDLTVLRRGNLQCSVIGLQDGGICLYSPVEKTSGAASSLAPVRFLFAPNHYHNKAIAEHVLAFPDARPICSNAARPRLERITSTDFGDLSELIKVLPQNVTLLEPAGLKTGEVWLCMETAGELAWIVTDAFCGVQENGMGTSRLGLLKTFPKYGVESKDVYVRWVRDRLEERAPSTVVPCHGGIVRGTGLQTDILALLETL